MNKFHELKRNYKEAIIAKDKFYAYAETLTRAERFEPEYMAKRDQIRQAYNDTADALNEWAFEWGATQNSELFADIRELMQDPVNLVTYRHKFAMDALKKLHSPKEIAGLIKLKERAQHLINRFEREAVRTDIVNHHIDEQKHNYKQAKETISFVDSILERELVTV